ncbi:hypothetical protein FSP39_018142 [Pinctada imbricata]|uniref:Uncharacterized protein n=1 Tax=Pinctada imbricata TaxID=66713 RepID=A0AA89C9B3_PINIB|nr:hypothetical protein FSP39_018142 [Pinctada imbricata]
MNRMNNPVIDGKILFSREESSAEETELADPSRWVNAGAIPDGIVPVKGAVHITVNRGFVEYVVKSPVAERFKKWVKNVEFPDEVFFSSLNHNSQLQIPGSYRGNPESDDVKKPFLSRFKNWGIPPNNWTCGGKRVRMLCVFGISDLPLLASRLEFFANKFYLDYEPLALKCMEELHFNRTRDEYISHLEYDVNIYKRLDFLKDIIKITR